MKTRREEPTTPRTTSGLSLVELLLVMTSISLLAAIAIPSISSSLATARETAAVRTVATKLRGVRVNAMARASSVGARFTAAADGLHFQLIVDEDEDGVRMADVAAGIDRVVMDEPMEAAFHGMRFGIGHDTPGVDPSDDPLTTGSDPIRLGSTDIVIFGADGAGSSGTVYLCSTRGRQFAVRIHGVTGRVRALRYDDRTSRWVDA